MLYQITKQLFNILLCKASPEALPYTRSGLWSVLGLNFIWRFLGVFSHFGPFWGMVLAAAPMAALAGLLLWLLRYRQQEERFLKLFMALEGLTVVLGMLIWCAALPLVGTPLQAFPFLIGTFWQIFAIGHVMQYGLDISKGQGILIGMGLMFAVFVVCVPAVVLLAAISGVPLPE